jgi:hypothetical protein
MEVVVGLGEQCESEQDRCDNTSSFSAEKEGFAVDARVVCSDDSSGLVHSAGS